MNLDFNFYNPTKIFFGKESLKYLSDELENYGPKMCIRDSYRSACMRPQG